MSRPENDENEWDLVELGERIAERVRGNAALWEEIEWAADQRAALGKSAELRALDPDIDPNDLTKTGWGVIYHPDDEEMVDWYLSDLIAHRSQQAGGKCRRLRLSDSSFLRFSFEHGLPRGRLGEQETSRVPYYLMVIGGPERIPFEFQYALSATCAVGRLSFDDPTHYQDYANRIIALEERRSVPASPRMSLFSVRNGANSATRMLAEYLVKPLDASIPDWLPSNWDHELLGSGGIGEAGRDELINLLSRKETLPALLLLSSHGYGARCCDASQPSCQGAPVCAEWPGGKDDAVSAEHMLCAHDLLERELDLRGMVAFLFSCFGAGTPRLTDYPEKGEQTQLAERPFVSGISKALLRSGAAAVIGHVDKGWTTSFSSWKRGAPDQLVSHLQPTQGMLKELIRDEHPVGHALRPLTERALELKADLSEADDPSIRGLLAWNLTAMLDARNFILLGDPAVRLRGRPASGSSNLRSW